MTIGYNDNKYVSAATFNTISTCSIYAIGAVVPLPSSPINAYYYDPLSNGSSWIKCKYCASDNNYHNNNCSQCGAPLDH